MTDQKLLRFSLRMPPGWEETLIWQLQQDGWGIGLQENSFQAGHLDDEPVGTSGNPEVVFVIRPADATRLRVRVEELAQSYGWKPQEWNYATSELAQEDWEFAWRKSWKPFRCAGFVVHADFHERPSLNLRATDTALQIPTGSAFGTGGHPSTRIALRTLKRWYSEQPFDHLLDVGTGTGILAVAGALAGAKVNIGMDPDPPSAGQARQMARLNGVESQCHFWLGTLESAKGLWQVVFANLQSGLLQYYAPVLSQRLVPGGRLFTGGFMDKNEEATLLVFEKSGLELRRLHKHGRWRAAELRK
ncbi:MAG: 50S ribosomal protein L11 methyltransferase [Planctomycetes bacterium]|nr:50S ribosomal protein L11 methyltransferase [Planctomycetota bacterium]